MTLQSEYQNLYEAVLREHKEVFEQQDIAQLRTLMDAIKEASRIFVIGAGREGIAAKAFSMRLMHLGKEVHWVWDDTAPGMGKGDLFIVVNGSGKIGHIDYVFKQAQQTGVKIAVITGAPEEETPKAADLVLFIPACVYKGTDPRAVPSIQPMGALFEQHCFLLYDIIIMMLEKEMNLTHEQMAQRHRNIE